MKKPTSCNCPSSLSSYCSSSSSSSSSSCSSSSSSSSCSSSSSSDRKCYKCSPNYAYYNALNIIWLGIRRLKKNKFIMVGTAGLNGILNVGPIEYNVFRNILVSYPNSYSTSVYGPEKISGSCIRLVGTYRLSTINGVFGFIYQGKVKDINNLSKTSNWETVVTGGKYTYIQSSYNKLAVGNCDNPAYYGKNALPLGPSYAFLYDIKKKSFITVSYPNSVTTTVYGIWYNGNNKYTLCGGYSNLAYSVNQIYTVEGIKPIGSAYLVDYDYNTNTFSNWTSFDYPNSKNYLTHFLGISGYGKYGYSLASDSASKTIYNDFKSSWVSVQRDKYTGFTVNKWTDFKYPNTVNPNSANAVADNYVVGVVSGDGIGFQIQIPNC
jgi:hypothetical protein